MTATHGDYAQTLRDVRKYAPELGDGVEWLTAPGYGTVLAVDLETVPQLVAALADRYTMQARLDTADNHARVAEQQLDRARERIDELGQQLADSEDARFRCFGEHG